MSPPCIQRVSSVVLTPLFQPAIGPCVSVLGYTAGLETFHVSHDMTSAVFDHYTITMSGREFTAFKRFNKHPPISFSHLVKHLVSLGIVQIFFGCVVAEQ